MNKPARSAEDSAPAPQAIHGFGRIEVPSEPIKQPKTQAPLTPTYFEKGSSNAV